MMRTLKFAILGLLHRAPLTGYDISKEFEKDLVNFWYAKHSQIYPELKRLAEEGCVSFSVENGVEKPDRKVYTITETGERQLLEWLARDEELEPTPKDVFKLRMYFSDEMSEEELWEQLNRQYQKRKLKYARLQEFARRYEEPPETGTAAFGDYMVLTSANMREEAYLKWLRHCMKEVKRQHPELG